MNLAALLRAERNTIHGIGAPMEIIPRLHKAQFRTVYSALRSFGNSLCAFEKTCARAFRLSLATMSNWTTSRRKAAAWFAVILMSGKFSCRQYQATGSCVRCSLRRRELVAATFCTRFTDSKLWPVRLRGHKKSAQQ